MAASVSRVLLLLLVFVGTAHGAAVGVGGRWCVCKEGLSDSVLQKTLDYACGAGADCSPVRPSGACYNPTSVRAHCSYAVNSYYQKNPSATDSCDFGGTAALTTSNPSTNGCSFPTSATSSGSGSTGTTPVSSSTPISGGSPTVSGSPKTTTTPSPYTTTVQPSTGTTGTTVGPTTTSYPNGLTAGIAPTGTGMDDNHAGTVGPPCTALLLSFLMLLLLLRN